MKILLLLLAATSARAVPLVQPQDIPTNSAFTFSSVTVTGSAFSVGASSFTVTGGSATLAYRFNVGSISMSGSSSTIVTNSSVTAGAYYGDGSHLTGVTSKTNGASVTQTGPFTTTSASLIKVTGMSSTFTVVGTTVACWFSGDGYGSNATSSVIFGIFIDNTVGPNSDPMVQTYFSVCCNPLQVGFGPIEFQVTSGSHNFALGADINGGTLTLNNGQNMTFGCREVNGN